MSLENYTLVELRQLAKERAVKNSSKLKKDELIEILSKIPENEEIGSIQNIYCSIRRKRKYRKCSK